MLGNSDPGPVRVGAAREVGGWQFMTSLRDVSYFIWLSGHDTVGDGDCMWLVYRQTLGLSGGWKMRAMACSGRFDRFLCEIDAA